MHLIWNTVQHGKFPPESENRDNISWVEGVSDMDYELCSCADIVVNQTLTQYGHLMLCHYFFWNFQRTVHHHQPTNYGHLVQCHCDCLIWDFKLMSIVITPKYLVTWCSDTIY